MSLLLDALKKAAEDKKKNISGGDEPLVGEDALLVSETRTTETESEIDLNLELQNEDGYELALDDVAVNGNEIEDKENLERDDEFVENNDESSNQLLHKEEDSINREELAKEDLSLKISAKEDVTVQGIDAGEKTEAEKRSLGGNQQALSALINKSNKYSRANKSRRVVLFASIALIALVFTGLFYYFEVMYAADSVFVADGAEVINRNTIEPDDVRPKSGEAKPIINNAVDIDKERISKSPTVKQASPVKKKVAKVTSSKPKNNSAVRFEKRNLDDPVSTLVMAAYAEFQKENYTNSAELYSRALDIDERNRDALLGVAAIAVKDNQLEFARQKYMALLKLNPKDSLAKAGLSNLESQKNSRLNESSLKIMISEQPAAAHLYFALGNIYSKQNRWAEAQTAYFSAWSSESINADYSYNLAVSLDQLGKRKSALDFYRLSLKLNNSNKFNIPFDVINKRIDLLAGDRS